eukprot:scaffold120727_cov23-Tisochrysis_lutea.AAC.1
MPLLTTCCPESSPLHSHHGAFRICTPSPSPSQHTTPPVLPQDSFSSDLPRPRSVTIPCGSVIGPYAILGAPPPCLLAPWASRLVQHASARCFPPISRPLSLS